MAWVWLTLAGLLEVVWATALKQSHGFTRLWPSLVTVLGAAGSFWLLALAMRSLPLGTAYAIWVGIGAVGAVVTGVVWLGEPATAARLLAVALIVAGIALMKVAG